jgi:hypothetical protein
MHFHTRTAQPLTTLQMQVERGGVVEVLGGAAVVAAGAVVAACPSRKA